MILHTYLVTQAGHLATGEARKPSQTATARSMEPPTSSDPASTSPGVPIEPHAELIDRFGTDRSLGGRARGRPGSARLASTISRRPGSWELPNTGTGVSEEVVERLSLMRVTLRGCSLMLARKPLESNTKQNAIFAY